MGLVAKKVKLTRLARGEVVVVAMVVGAEAVGPAVGVGVVPAGMACRASAKTAFSCTLIEMGKVTRQEPHRQVVAAPSKQWLLFQMTGRGLKLSVVVIAKMAFVWEHLGCG